MDWMKRATAFAVMENHWRHRYFVADSIAADVALYAYVSGAPVRLQSLDVSKSAPGLIARRAGDTCR
jgi:hypothetical protein